MLGMREGCLKKWGVCLAESGWSELMQENPKELLIPECLSVLVLFLHLNLPKYNFC